MDAMQPGRLCTLSPDEIRRRITDSNKQSANRTAKYVYWEKRAISNDYQLIACPCEEGCWCKRNACAGHYQLKEITFEVFLATYVTLWIPKNSRQNVKGAVLEGLSFKGRQKRAVEHLRDLRGNWPHTLDQARGYDRCGLCDLAVPMVPVSVSNVYEAKMWSQLFYDSIVPFDTKSKAEIKRAGYFGPAKDFLGMNRQLFGDLRKLSDAHDLGVLGLRQLDSPGMVDPQLQEPTGGQPLSRVIDKIFYRP